MRGSEVCLSIELVGSGRATTGRHRRSSISACPSGSMTASKPCARRSRRRSVPTSPYRWQPWRGAFCINMRLCVSWRIGTSQTHRRSCSCSGDSVIFKTHEQISEIRICSDTQPARPPFLARGFTCARSLQDLSSVLEDCPDAVPAHATTIFQRRARVHSFLGYAWRENRFSRERRPGRPARDGRAPSGVYET